MSNLDDVRKLILSSELYEERFGEDYVIFCEKIRTAITSLSDDVRCPDVERFFQKKFVEEMETLAKIWMHSFKKSVSPCRIRYLKKDPPDGTIHLPSGQTIAIECTTAIDRRWENFALEQWRTKRRIVSLSGYSSKDLAGNRVSGYTLKGFSVEDPDIQEYLCEADSEDDVRRRHREQIAATIEKKLDKKYNIKHLWLSISVNEMVFPDWHKVMRPVLDDIVREYRSQLASQHIDALYFVGNRSVSEAFMGFYPLFD